MNKIFGVFAIISALISFASAQQYGCPGFGMMGYGGSFGYVFGWIFMTLVIVALVLLIMWLIKQLQTNNKRR